MRGETSSFLGLLIEETIRKLKSAILLSLLGLAPGGGCLATRITASAGGLLHHLFTLAERGDSIVESSLGPFSILYSRSSVVIFCGPIQRVTPFRVLPGAVL